MVKILFSENYGKTVTTLYLPLNLPNKNHSHNWHNVKYSYTPAEPFYCWYINTVELLIDSWKVMMCYKLSHYVGIISSKVLTFLCTNSVPCPANTCPYWTAMSATGALMKGCPGYITLPAPGWAMWPPYWLATFMLYDPASTTVWHSSAHNYQLLYETVIC